MYTCPNCSELIGDNVRVCPICQHPVTEEEYRKAESIKESLQEQSVLKAMEEYRRRTNSTTGIRMSIISAHPDTTVPDYPRYGLPPGLFFRRQNMVAALQQPYL